MIEVSDRA